MALSLVIFYFFKFVNVSYIHFVEIKNMETTTKAEGLEKIEEDDDWDVI